MCRGHNNGLDRLDSSVRVYNNESCVSSCGTCNIMKYRWSVKEFLDHCLRVAIFAASTDASTAGTEDAEVDWARNKDL